MINTSLYTTSTKGYQWEVAHLFEHLVINGFYKLAQEQGYNTALIGWIDADTFEDRIYLDVGFYDKKVANLYASYMNNLPVFNDSEIETCMGIMMAEDRALYVVTDKEVLKQAINELSRKGWVEEGSIVTQTQFGELLRSSKATAKFRDITIGIYADNLTEDEQKLFLRFEVLLNDIFTHAIGSNFNGYCRGVSPVQKDNHIISALLVCTVAKGAATTQQIRALLEKALVDFDTSKNIDQIDAHFRAFSEVPLWKNLAISYYRWTGINTTTQEIASLANRSNIDSLLSKIKIVVRPSRSTDYNNL